MGFFGRNKRRVRMQPQIDSLLKKIKDEANSLQDLKTETDIKKCINKIKDLTINFNDINKTNDLDMQLNCIIEPENSNKSFNLNNSTDLKDLKHFYIKRIRFQKYLVLKEKLLSKPLESKDGVDETCLNIITKYREQWTKLPLSESEQIYFNYMHSIAEYKKQKNYEKMAIDCTSTLTFLEPFLINQRLFHWHLDNQTKNIWVKDADEYFFSIDQAHQYLSDKYNTFLVADDEISEMQNIDIKHIPAIDELLTYYAINRMSGQLKNLEGLINYFPDLHRLYSESLVQTFLMLEYTSVIIKHIEKNPGTIQANLRKDIEKIDDGRLSSNICFWLGKYNKIKRIKSGKSYELYLK